VDRIARSGWRGPFCITSSTILKKDLTPNLGIYKKTKTTTRSQSYVQALGESSIPQQQPLDLEKTKKHLS